MKIRYSRWRDGGFWYLPLSEHVTARAGREIGEASILAKRGVRMNKDDAEEFTQALGQIVGGLAQITGGSYRIILQAEKLGVPKALGVTQNQWVNDRLGGYVKYEVDKRRAIVDELSKEGESNLAIAGALGVSEATVRNDLNSQNCDPPQKKTRKNKTNQEKDSQNYEPSDPVAEIDSDQDFLEIESDPSPAERATETRLDNQSAYRWIFEQPGKRLDGDPIRLGDFYDLSIEIEDGVVDLIFTDPPYDDKSIPLFEKMAEVAKRILKPGGSLVTYVGHLQMLSAGAAMSKHLRYWHPLVCLHSGKTSRMTEYGVIETYKPMLWFVKGTRSDKHTFIESAIGEFSDVVSGGREKSHHDWQQAESEAAYFIERLTPKNGFVVDFFSGGGTTLVSAKRLGRYFVGYEINQKHRKSAIDRLESTCQA